MKQEMHKVTDIEATAVVAGLDGKVWEKGKPETRRPAIRIGSHYFVMEKSQAQDVVDQLRKVLKGMV